jgi:hypothetical protein
MRIHLRDGTEYTGRVVYYDAHMLYADREIVLGPPLTRKPTEASEFEPLPPVEGWQRVVILATSIEAMRVRNPRRQTRWCPTPSGSLHRRLVQLLQQGRLNHSGPGPSAWTSSRGGWRRSCRCPPPSCVTGR